MLRLKPPLILLLLAFLAQNLSEAAADGPNPPEAVSTLLPADLNPSLALVLISLLGSAILLAAMFRPTRQTLTLCAMLAGGLILNALVQALGSLAQGRLMPGTVAGLFLMLPTALFAFAALRPRLGPKSTILATVGGALLTPVVLLAVWWVSSLWS